ncbi:hypothetical protein DSO57_1036863 [Entomophthora muscae]|uniref:Uncharacterized protein n=1 Tax=Entomophthora muscae TaxID=34485 RepID=A0ACC2RQ33_9FUNG|nr:hypothetical protein DSO57_1036863 [Entomophthora muscae]
MAFAMNAAIHHILISPPMGYFKDKSLSFAFAPQNEFVSKLGNTIVWFPDSLQLSCPTNTSGFPVGCLCCASEHGSFPTLTDLAEWLCHTSRAYLTSVPSARTDPK